MKPKYEPEFNAMRGALVPNPYWRGNMKPKTANKIIENRILTLNERLSRTKPAESAYKEIWEERQALMMLTKPCPNCEAKEREVERLEKWIPVSEGLPEENKPFWVTIHDKVNDSCFARQCAHRRGIWFYCDDEGSEKGFMFKWQNVIAFYPLPSPYQQSGEGLFEKEIRVI